MKLNASLDKKFTGIFSEQVVSELESFCSHEACAGIRGDTDSAYKARTNHYGTEKIPARRFINAATHNVLDGNYGSELKKVIKEGIVRKKRAGYDFSPHEQETIKGEFGEKYPETAKRVKSIYQERSGGHAELFEKIANKMKENLREAILAVNIEVDDSRAYHNAPATIRKKHMDHPLVETGKMIASIQSWEE